MSEWDVEQASIEVDGVKIPILSWYAVRKEREI